MKFSDLTFRLSTVRWIVGLVIAGAIFLYSTFATIGYVDAKHQTGMDILVDIQSDVKVIKKTVTKE